MATLYTNADVICCSETWLTPRLPDGLINIQGKTLFRLDRGGDNVKKSGGGVCIYLDNKLGSHCKVNVEKSKCTCDFEILCLNITRPGLKYLSVVCLYRPPNGKIKPCVDFLKTLFSTTRYELWILGDFNVDFLDRNNVDRTKLLSMFKTHGLKQLITNITRPNKRGGTCIDWIVTNSLYVMHSGVTNDYISDHLSVYCVRKKPREKHNYVYRTVRDLSNYNSDMFTNLLSHVDWNFVETSVDIDYIWSQFYKRTYDILAIMCPFRRFRQRETVTPWLNAEIYRAMRKRDAFIKLFKSSGNTLYLENARRCRNMVNSMIQKAKADYIKNQLNNNTRNPKKFWRIIKDLLNPTLTPTVNAMFVNPNTGLDVQCGDEANFLNDYFINIVHNLHIPPCDKTMDNIYDVDSIFSFENDLPTVPEVTRLINEIDNNR